VLLNLVLMSPGCSQVPITGRKQLNLISGSIMNSMIFQPYSEFISQNKLSNNVEQTQMVERVGQRIHQAVENTVPKKTCH